MSLLVMSTSKLRRSVCFDQCEKEESAEQQQQIDPNSGLKQTKEDQQTKPEEEAKVVISTIPNHRGGRPKKSESTPSVHFSKMDIESQKTRKSSARFLSVKSAIESEESTDTMDIQSGSSPKAGDACAVFPEGNSTTPAQASKIRFSDDVTPSSSAQPKSAGTKSKNRKSLIPDLISFDTPEPIARTPSRRASRRKSVAPSALDSSVSELPQVAVLPPTPRRSTRLSIASHAFGN